MIDKYGIKTMIIRFNFNLHKNYVEARRSCFR